MGELEKKHEAEISQLNSRLLKQEFRAEKFENCDDAVQKLTGLQSHAMLKAVFHDFVVRDNQHILNIMEITPSASKKYPDRSITGRKRMSLNYFNQFFLCLLKLRSGMTDHVIGQFLEYLAKQQADITTAGYGFLMRFSGTASPRGHKEILLIPLPEKKCQI